MTIKDRMKSGYQAIVGALDSCDITQPKRKIILNEYKSICYMWAETNATACLLEGYFKEAAPEAYEEAVRRGIREGFGLYTKLAPTAEEWDAPDGDEGEDDE